MQLCLLGGAPAALAGDQLIATAGNRPDDHRLNHPARGDRGSKFGQRIGVEVAARLKTSDQPELAKQFLAFLITKDAQEKLPTTNWMYPVIDLGDALPQVFRDTKVPEKALLMPSDEVAVNRSAWIEEWLNSAGQ